MSHYAQHIRETLARSGHVGKYDPRHIEGWMRLEKGTLDGMTARQFDHEVEIARQCVDVSGTDESESLALSYGC